MDEIEVLTDQHEQVMSASAPGPSSVSRNAGKGVCRRLFGSKGDDSECELSIRVDSFADLVTVPRSVLDGIWEKAFELATDPSAIASAPGYETKVTQ